MKSTGKAVRVLATAAVLATGLIANSEAAVITVTPNTQTIAPGGTANVDIVLSGLGATETVGGFSFLLSFNNSILGAPDSFTPNPGNVMGATPLDLSGGFAGGTGSPLDVFYLAESTLTLSEAALKTAEGSGFTLATVHLTGLAEGLSQLTLSVSPSTGVFLSDYLGTGTVAATAVNGSVCVDDPQTPGNRCLTVSEPATLPMTLLAMGMVVFGLRRRNPHVQD